MGAPEMRNMCFGWYVKIVWGGAIHKRCRRCVTTIDRLRTHKPEDTYTFAQRTLFLCDHLCAIGFQLPGKTPPTKKHIEPSPAGPRTQAETDTLKLDPAEAARRRVWAHNLGHTPA